jgi:hypothetical protein
MAREKFNDDSASGINEGATMVQRVVREVGGGMTFPVLTKTNYLGWAMLTRVKLKARNMWAPSTKGGIDPHEDMMVLDALVSAVPAEKVATMVDKNSAM